MTRFLWVFLVALSFASASAAKDAKSIEICSFNIQFAGMFKARDDKGLAKLMKAENCDIVVVQELVAAPNGAQFLSKNSLHDFPFLEQESLSRSYLYPKIGEEPQSVIEASDKSTHFFYSMAKSGFGDFILSPEDTGVTKNHNRSSSAEWFVAFYKSDKVAPAPELPKGFLDVAVVGPGRKFDRTPYAFPFRTADKSMDFVLISVHLHPGAGAKNAARRKEELNGIMEWVSEQEETSPERNYIILGDMNMENRAEIKADLPEGWISLNSECQRTNTAKVAQCYDQVWLKQKYGTNATNFQVVPLVDKMRERWHAKNPGKSYPGGGELEGNRSGKYRHDAFRTTYSDHSPVKFKLITPQHDVD